MKINPIFIRIVKIAFITVAIILLLWMFSSVKKSEQGVTDLGGVNTKLNQISAQVNPLTTQVGELAAEIQPIPNKLTQISNKLAPLEPQLTRIEDKLNKKSCMVYRNKDGSVISDDPTGCSGEPWVKNIIG